MESGFCMVKSRYSSTFYWKHWIPSELLCLCSNGLSKLKEALTNSPSLSYGTIPGKPLWKRTKLWIYDVLNMHTGFSAGLWHRALNWIFQAGTAQRLSWMLFFPCRTPAFSFIKAHRTPQLLWANQLLHTGCRSCREASVLSFNISIQAHTLGHLYFFLDDWNCTHGEKMMKGNN